MKRRTTRNDDDTLLELEEFLQEATPCATCHGEGKRSRAGKLTLCPACDGTGLEDQDE